MHRKEDEFVRKKLISGDDSEDGQNADKSHIGLGHWRFVAFLLSSSVILVIGRIVTCFKPSLDLPG